MITNAHYPRASAQGPQWSPEPQTVPNSLCTVFFSYTYEPVIKFNLSIRCSRRSTTLIIKPNNCNDTLQ